jgi:hypothetical protein
MEPRVESCFNIQACHTESISIKLDSVAEDLAELSVRTEEEADGRINEGYVLIVLYYVKISCLFYILSYYFFVLYNSIVYNFTFC